MSYAVQSPYAYYTDRDGSPLEGGYLYFGVTGLPAETNPKTVYWDEALTIPIAQPVRTRNGFAYNNGTPGIVWISGDASLMVKNKKGAVVYSALSNNSISDQIPASVDPFPTLALSTGSDLIGHKGTGVSATTTTVGAKLRQIVNIKDYGAVGDGIADDTLAVQRAITNSTGIVYIPAGTFKITGVTLTAGKQLIGENRATSILKLGAALNGAGMINAVYADGIVVENLTINGSSLPGTKNGLINFFGCNSSRIENNNIINTDQFAIACNSQSYTTIRGNKILMTQRVGAWIDTSTVVPGSGGPVSASGLVGTISAPAGVGGVQAAFTYSTNGSGAVDPASIVFSNNGFGYLTNPTASFPAVPGSSCTARYGGAQVVAITHSNTLATGENIEISHNFFEGGGCNLAIRNSNISGNVSRFVIYGAAFVSEQSSGVNRNIYSNNLVHRMGYCNLTGAAYTNTYIGPDTDNTVSSGFELWGLYESCHNNVLYENAGNGISFGSQGGSTNNNIIFDNGKYWATIGLYTTRGIQISYGNATYNGSFSIHTGNRCFDQNGATGTQGYGIGTQGASVEGLKLVDNDCVNNRLGPYDINGATVTYFRGRRINGRSAVNPASLPASGAADYAVTVPGLDTGNWLLSANFIGLTTEPMMLTARYSAANTATIRLFNFTASAYDLPSGSFLVQAEEVIA